MAERSCLLPSRLLQGTRSISARPMVAALAQRMNTISAKAPERLTTTTTQQPSIALSHRVAGGLPPALRPALPLVSYQCSACIAAHVCSFRASASPTCARLLAEMCCPIRPLQRSIFRTEPAGQGHHKPCPYRSPTRRGCVLPHATRCASQPSFRQIVQAAHRRRQSPDVTPASFPRSKACTPRLRVANGRLAKRPTRHESQCICTILHSQIKPPRVS
jgi:hypothetical protein